MPVQYDATGPGDTDNGTNGQILVLSWTHTPVNNDNLAVVVGVGVGRAGYAAPTATYAGLDMQVLETVGIGSIGAVRLLGILGPPPGPQTVEVRLGLSSSTGMAANSISYTGVGSFGQAVTSNTSSITVHTPPDGMSTAVAGGSASGFSSFSGGTARWEIDTNQIFVLWATGGADSTTIGDTTYTYSVGGTRGSVAVPLIPAMPFLSYF